MTKINLSERLSKKNTIIAIALIVVFIAAGILASIFGYITYIDTREANITNFSHSANDSFHMRSDGVNLVYKYSDDTTKVDLEQVLKLSKGANFSVKAVLDEDFNKIETISRMFDVENDEKYYVLLTVTSNGGVHKNGYLIEIVNELYYSESSPNFDLNDEFKQYINAD